MSHIPDSDLEVEDVLGDFGNKKKKINSKKKGNRVELELTKLLTAKFGKQFSRSIGSGNRGWQVANLPSHAKETLTGDICAPEDFKWVIECKGGYEDKIDLNGIFNGNACLDAFIKQSEHDAAESNGKRSLIIWKRSRKPFLAMAKIWCGLPDACFINYRGWYIMELQWLLDNKPLDFWFETKPQPIPQSTIDALLSK